MNENITCDNECICNLCGAPLNLFDMQENIYIHKTIGYGSKHDGERIDIHFCCDCFDKIIDACKVTPIITGETNE